jgi:hypothetical protein
MSGKLINKLNSAPPFLIKNPISHGKGRKKKRAWEGENLKENFKKLKGFGWFKIHKSWKEQKHLREKMKDWRVRIENLERESLKSRERKLEFEKKE